MRFEELNWFDVEEYLLSDDRIMLTLGACEQHGYLSLMTDAKIPLALADAASKQTGVLVAPGLNFGSSPYFLAYPGTISIRVTTLLDIAEDIVRSVYRNGFRRFLFLNGHSGNDVIRGRLFELANDLPDMHMKWYSWWQSHSIQELALRHDLKPTHANWLEAFPFTIVSDLPDGEKTPPKVPGLLGAEQAKEIYGDGVFGGPYAADESVMEELFRAALKDILNMLEFE